MRRRVWLLPRADADLVEIGTHIASDSPASALRFLDAAKTTIESLRDTPLRAARLRTQTEALSEVRWVRIAGFDAYLAFYLVDEASVRVIRVLHGARDLPAVLPDGLD